MSNNHVDPIFATILDSHFPQTSLVDCSATEAIEIWEREKASIAAQREADYEAFLERELVALTEHVAAESNSPPEAVAWRDCWCCECDTNETIKGTARQLAEKIQELGWSLNAYKNLECRSCMSEPWQHQSGRI